MSCSTATTGAITNWLYRDPANPIIPMLDQAGFTRTGREVALKAPLSADDVRALKVGDVVLVSGRMFTGRDAVHSYLMKNAPPVDLSGSVLYHCGPVVVKDEKTAAGWRVTAAGPTTSIREEPYQGEIIKRYGVRAVIGKGGMGAKTLAAMKEHGAVYLNAIGGAAQFYARTINSDGCATACQLPRTLYGHARGRCGISTGATRRAFPTRIRRRPWIAPRQQPAQGHRGRIESSGDSDLDGSTSSAER